MMKTLMTFAAVLLLLIIMGCDDFVDVDMPSSQLTGQTVFEDRATANAAMADIYSKLRDDSVLSGLTTGTTFNFGLYADELDYFGSADEGASLVYSNSLLASSAVPQQLWNTGYHIIYCANAVIEGCANSVVLADQDKAQFTAEALFVRAIVHSYLVDIYGGIPYITTTDYRSNSRVTRLDVTSVYDKVITDLNQAVTLFSDDGTSGRVRPGKGAAYALLARSCLYAGRWAEASDAASAVINNPGYGLVNNLEEVFLMESMEAIWQFSPKLEGNNADEATVFYFESGPPPFVALAEELVDSFDSSDLRRSAWIRSVSDGGSTWYHAYKYRQNLNTGASMEYSVVLRLAEQYLIRAEARVRQGDLIGAQEDLNMVRNRAGLPNTAAATAVDLLEAILQERRWELFTEYGHRFFDLKRMGQLSILSATKPGWDATDALWPIPESEIRANAAMEQNPGY